MAVEVSVVVEENVLYIKGLEFWAKAKRSL